jgi:hypothetical protein
MSGEWLEVPVERMPDEELRLLCSTYERMAEDGDMSATLRSWYADLALAIRAGLTTRFFAWQALSSRADVPPSWDAAVAALDPRGEGEDCR